MQYKIYKTLFILLLIVTIVIATLVILKYGGSYLNDRNIRQVAAAIYQGEDIDYELSRL